MTGEPAVKHVPIGPLHTVCLVDGPWFTKLAIACDPVMARRIAELLDTYGLDNIPDSLEVLP